MDDGARQASAHDGVQADAGVSHGVRAVCRFPARLFRLEYASVDHRANHADGRYGDHRLGRAISPGRYPPARVRRRCAVASARLSLYLVTTRAGEGLAGNVGSLSTGILETSGWTETAYRRLDDPDGAEHHALIRV